MFRKVKLLTIVWLFAVLTGQGFGQQYKPDWSSLVRHQTPKWLQEGKFGIYTHWGIYAVHAHGSNTTWYSFALYRDPNSDARKHFERTFGPLTPDFGYKDLIPKFTAEKFNPDEWAELFKKAGAKFAGPVAEHHDGFAMWDTKYSEWNAAKMGPKRDIVGELEKAYKKAGMKYLTAFHHAANWFFFPVWDKRYDTGDPKYSGLYGQPHKPGEKRNQAFIDEWYGKIIEVIDKYDPDFIWFDFALDAIPEGYVKDFLAYYYNKALEEGKEVIVSYKQHDLVPGAGIRDLELGQEHTLTYNDWITDTSIDDRGAWGYAEDLTFKTPNRIIDNLVDRVSKNGYLLLNVGPKPDGTIPEGAKKVLLEIGSWLNMNGEAIYGTTPWFIAGEGPTKLGKADETGFNEENVVYTPEDIRFTVKGDVLYATFLDWPGKKAVIKTLRDPSIKINVNDLPDWAKPEKSLPLAGTKWEIKNEEGETVKYEFYKNGKFKVAGGEAGKGMMGEYRQVGEDVYLQVGGFSWYGKYDGNEFKVVEDESPHYEGFYKEEIKRITLLGYDKDLDWVMTPQGLVIKMPDKKIGNYAHVVKIERFHHPKIK
ncbi:MAG: alpha-L-fucosidase [Caldisericaceae bacterium]|nr:alpha-L-fucosidase [Caldisericaceae bacterium]